MRKIFTLMAVLSALLALPLSAYALETKTVKVGTLSPDGRWYKNGVLNNSPVGQYLNKWDSSDGTLILQCSHNDMLAIAGGETFDMRPVANHNYTFSTTGGWLIHKIDMSFVLSGHTKDATMNFPDGTSQVMTKGDTTSFTKDGILENSYFVTFSGENKSCVATVSVTMVKPESGADSLTYHFENSTFTGKALKLVGAPYLPQSLKRKVADNYRFYSDSAYSAVLDSVTSATTDVYVKYDQPEYVSAGLDSAKWYSLLCRGTKYAYYRSDNAENVHMATLSSGQTKFDDVRLWAFVGNPYDGYKVYNKAVGDSLALMYSGTPANGVAAKLGTEDVMFHIIPKTGTNDMVGLANNAGGSFYLNDYASTGIPKFYNVGPDGDNGSAFKLELVPTDFKQNIVEEFGSYFTSNNRAGEPFCQPLDEYNTMKATYDSLAATCTYDQYRNFVASFAAKRQLTEVPTGVYRLVNYQYKKYMQRVESGSEAKLQCLNTALSTDDIKRATLATITKLDNGKYSIYFNGGSVQQATRSRVEMLGATEFEVDILTDGTHFGHGVVYAGTGDKNTFGDSNNNAFFLHYNQNSNATDVVGWSVTNSDPSFWRFEKVEDSELALTFNNTGKAADYAWSTAYKPYNFTLPDSVKAFTLSSAGELTEVGGAVRGGMPVILRAPLTMESVTLQRGGDSVAVAPADNILKGTYSTLTVTSGEKYTLQRKGGSDGGAIGMMLFTGTTIPAGKAYVDKADVDGSPARSSFVDFESWGVPTGIGSAKAEAAGAVYDLQGRRVASPKAGLYIVGGRKVVLK